MKFLILLLSLGMSTEWGTSISTRTPNDDTKPLDYELSIKLEDKNNNFKYLLKRDWERELGIEYIDDVIKLSHQVYDGFFYGVDYVNKESKDIKYSTYNIGLAHPSGFKSGISIKEDKTLFAASFDKKLKVDDLEYNVSISIKTNLQEDSIYNLKSEVKKWLSEKINVFALYKHEYYNKQEDFQFKVGLGVKLWK